MEGFGEGREEVKGGGVMAKAGKALVRWGETGRMDGGMDMGGHCCRGNPARDFYDVTSTKSEEPASRHSCGQTDATV
eukprot:362032-Chlamydomonas_euryale.AAC.8